MFFIFGFVTWAIAVLIPYLEIACELTKPQSQLVSFAFYISYAFMAIPSGYILKKIGYKNSLTVGLVCMAVGALLFIPAAYQRAYWLFLCGLFLQGIGLAVLQTAANPYVTILGPHESGAKRMSIMGVCNGVAGILGPIILGSIVLSNADEIKTSVVTMSEVQRAATLNQLAQKVIMPYIIIAVVLVVISFLIYNSSLPEVNEEDDDAANKISTYSNGKNSILQFPHLLLGVFTLFIYVGVEAIAGNTIIGYGEFQHIKLDTAKFFTSLTIFCMMIGYGIGIIGIPKYFSQEQSLKISAFLGIFFVLMAMITNGITSVLFIALLGLANSLMWPAIWPLAIADLGKFTKIGSALLVMAIAGGGVLPWVHAQLGEFVNTKNAYWMVVPCYLIIAYYAFYGHKIRVKT
ncbi:MAG: sugar MFS transporter [Niabella sp.]